jgi:PKD repeat protein
MTGGAAVLRGVVSLVLWAGLCSTLQAQGTSAQQNPAATFATPGPHPVTLTSCNLWGCHSITKTVTVLDPRPAVTLSTLWVTKVEVGQAVPLTGAGSGQPPLSYSWRVFQGTNLIKELPGAAAWWQTDGVAPGLYTLVLRITNASGMAESLPKTVLVVASVPLDFYTLSPCRVLDTRYGSPLGSGTAKILSLEGGCEIPADARAIAANVTIVNPLSLGTVALYPGNYPPVGTATINFVPGNTISNNGILALSTDGSTTLAAFASLAAGGTVNLVIDVFGYFVPGPP